MPGREARTLNRPRARETSGDGAPDPLRGAWTGLFPLTYGVHLCEELLAGDTFPRWISRVGGADFSRAEFLALNAVAMTAMLVVVTMTQRLRRARWLLASLGFLVTFNGILHTVASIVTRSYSPGLFSGLLLWVPLGVFTLRRCRGTLAGRELLAGLGGGILAHALVALAAFTL
jgi:hypothetical protein